MLCAGFGGGSYRRLEGGGGCRQHPGCGMQRKHVGRGLMGENAGRPRQEQCRCCETEPAVDQLEGQVYNAKDGQTYSSTIKPTGVDQLEIQGCVLGFLCGGETWTRVAGPIPSRPANSMAKGGPKTTGAAPKPATPQTTTANAPKTTAPVNPAPKAAPGQKLQAAAQPADTVGDICLLPDIARFTH